MENGSIQNAGLLIKNKINLDAVYKKPKNR
jgi:hypothetical protein